MKESGRKPNPEAKTIRITILHHLNNKKADCVGLYGTVEVFTNGPNPSQAWCEVCHRPVTVDRRI